MIPRDYLYMGRIQIAQGADSLGVQSLRKAYQMDTTQADVFLEIAKNSYAKQKYLAAATAYQDYFDKSHKGSLNEHLAAGLSYFYAFDQNNPKADSSLLAKADSQFVYINRKAGSPVAEVVLQRAFIYDLKDNNRNNIQGLAKPFYEQYIATVTAKAAQTEREKKYLAVSYAYLASIYEYKDKDDAKAAEAYNKAKEYDPNNKQVVAYFSRKPGAKTAK